MLDKLLKRISYRQAPVVGDDGVAFYLAGKEFSRVRALAKNVARGRDMITKAGRMSMCGLMDGVPVKIYECFSEAQAELIERTASHAALGAHFPSCFLRIERYLVVAWVEGSQVTWEQVAKSPALLEQVAALQALVHSQNEAILEENRFDYLCFVQDRLHRYKGILPIDSALEKMKADLEAPCRDEARLSHPDFTADNLILEASTGVLKLIDNELFSQNRYYAIDLFNTHKSFGRKFAGVLLEPYLLRYMQRGGNLSSLTKHEPFFTALWYGRLIGSALQGFNLEHALELAQEYVNNPQKHPLITHVEELANRAKGGFLSPPLTKVIQR